MASALRPTGRFYAAFYRWSCSTVRAPHCTRSIRRSPPCFETRARHAYSTTRPLLHDNAAASTPEASRDERTSASADQEATILSPDPVSMQETMRSLMRHVPSTVTVITAFGEHTDSRTPLPVGSAISSLTTVTLDPPHVSFNIKTPSRTLDAIRETGGRFCVHFLDNSIIAAKVAQNFTEGNSIETLRRRRQKFTFEYPPTDHMQQPPKLVSRCVLASMTCKLVQEATVADHVVAIASVNELSARQDQAPALMYHEGKFKRYNGSTLYQHKAPALGQTFIGHGVYCSYPLFPGDAEKEDFISRAKEYIEQNQAEFLAAPSTSRATILKDGWGIQSGTFGLNLTRLVDQCMAELGLHSDQEPCLNNAPLTYRFYGQLSPTDITTIANQAKALVENNPAALDGDYFTVLDRLDVCPWGTNLLASDILVPLREGGLIAPFELRSIDPKATLDLGHLEQVEHRVFKFLKTIPREQAYRMKLGRIQNDAGLQQLHMIYLKQILPRITAEVCPDAFSSPQVDLRGQLSPEEVRVAVIRMVNALSDAKIYPTFTSLPKAEILRELGVHPMATGANLDFLWEKMNHMRATTKDSNALEEAVDMMLDTMPDPLFEKGSFKLEEVQSRVRKLVNSHPLSVLAWSTSDIVAAMGLRYGATTVPHKGKDVQIHSLIRKIFREALKARVGDDGVTAEEKAAINEYSRLFLAPRPKGWVMPAAEAAKFSRPKVLSWRYQKEEQKVKEREEKKEEAGALGV
ncbi:hypothetical protein P171DRAFT_432445 [Karstenula rhodostoma CBS 690.94]|uniref:Flavin reductase like domain-containing protein n=1 Tax=Karstenula rhodostoma CBS 690.94 TaxID=1392251 RepID=A0A9P4PHT1_9PLEO|nr:hypothetical protein P171DRAFT_432445 [Karstenula rhodostoma CBS 690.94]